MARNRDTQRGCTLIEMLFIVTILAVLMGTIGCVACTRLRQQQTRLTRYRLAAVAAALQAFEVRSSVKDCPANIAELHRRGVPARAPRDAWSQPILIECCLKESVCRLGARSAGPDGRFYTRDDLLSYPAPAALQSDPPLPWRRAAPLLLLLLPLLLLRRWTAPAPRPV
jgi:type II secretory pathway pseudopilin PulG